MKRLNSGLDFMALLMGATGLGLNAWYWSMALSDERAAVTLYVNRYHEGNGELIMFLGLTAFVAWRALRSWWRMSRG